MISQAKVENHLATDQISIQESKLGNGVSSEYVVEHFDSEHLEATIKILCAQTVLIMHSLHN